MDHDLFEEFNKIKKDIVLSFAKHSLSGSEKDNKEAVLNSVLFAWINPLKTVRDFNLKYNSFKKMDQIIRNSYLFDLVEMISNTEEDKDDKVRRALLIYDSFENDKEYQKLTKECGYKLPVEFGIKENYYNGALLRKIAFYNDFKRKLNDINDHLTCKGVVKR